MDRVCGNCSQWSLPFFVFLSIVICFRSRGRGACDLNPKSREWAKSEITSQTKNGNDHWLLVSSVWRKVYLTTDSVIDSVYGKWYYSFSSCFITHLIFNWAAAVSSAYLHYLSRDLTDSAGPIDSIIRPDHCTVTSDYYLKVTNFTIVLRILHHTEYHDLLVWPHT